QLAAADQEMCAYLLDADLVLAFVHHLPYRIPGIRDPYFSFHRVGDAEPRQHRRKIDAAQAGLGVGNRLGRGERAFERLGRTDVGALGALAHCDADGGAGEINAAAGNRLAVLDEVVDRLGGQDGEVANGAAFELLEETVRGARGDHDFRTAGALERGYEVEHDRLHAVGADDFHCGDPFTFATPFRVDAGWAKMPLLVPERERTVDRM